MSTLYTLSVISLIAAVAQCSAGPNDTANSTKVYVGWKNSPMERGTMTIIWSCLTTIVACTWTILHLNVGGPQETWWIRLRRKIKWLTITIVFPEFTFSKAVCELQMALEDHRDLKDKDPDFGWKVECDWVYKTLTRFMAAKDTDKQKRPATADDHSVPGPGAANASTHNQEHLTASLPGQSWYKGETAGQWTLTHSYFANMGGLVRPKSYGRSRPITAHCLVHCCIPGNHNPLQTLRFSKEEILDKAKADPLVKALALVQILWLLLSVIVRVAYSLPVSQLEVCTLAFAVLACATYAANWHKPKGVEVPIWLPDRQETSQDPQIPYTKESQNGSIQKPQNTTCSWSLNMGKSVSAQLLHPSQELSSYPLVNYSVGNDFLRLHMNKNTGFGWALVVSTILFGAIHCAAWRTNFPTHTERIIWLIASLISTVLPLNSILVSVLGVISDKYQDRRTLLCLRQVLRTSRSSNHNNANTIFWQAGPFVHKDLDWETLPHMVERPAFRGQDSVVVVGGSMNSVVTQAHDFFHATAELNDACRDVLQGRINSYETLENLVISLRMCETKYDTFKDNGWTFVPPPNHTVGFVPVTSLVPRDNSKLNEERNWAVILNVFDNRDDIRKLWSKKRAYYKKREEISRGQTIVTALIYAASRLIILILAFAALRKQDARLYQETWTSNLLHGG